ncbi:MAG: isoprenylcysteine carboxyl methyltransferase [Planctomycetes bacterium]|nr:isoprenylcysteine carboxyl methyltransferase [Planctomycetota bacterium]
MEWLRALRRAAENLVPAALWGYMALRACVLPMARRLEEGRGLDLDLVCTALFLLDYLVVMVLFVIRRPYTGISATPWTIATTLVGTFGPLLASRTEVGWDHPLPLVLMTAATVMVFLSALSLNTSFGLLPTDRGIKTGGMYRLVRHPLYGSYQVANLGFLLSSYSHFNLAVMGVALVCQVFRLRSEEALLGRNPEYAEYLRRVRWRLCPYVY